MSSRTVTMGGAAVGDTEGHRKPAGESEIQALNPNRVQRILAATGWSELSAGTLNLEVDDSVVPALGSESPFIEEDAADIRYPRGQEHIPVRRGGYWYFKASITFRDHTLDALVRRARKVPLPNRVELLAPVNLRVTLGIQDGDSIEVVVRDSASIDQ